MYSALVTELWPYSYEELITKQHKLLWAEPRRSW